MKSKVGTRLVPSLLAADLAETIAFYLKVGFKLDDTHPKDGLPTWAALVRDGITLMFYSEAPTGTPDHPICSGTLYLYPENLDALMAELEGVVPFAWGPEVMPYGMREFAIQDPNGYHLAFVEPP
ncbi:MAG: VOC family protein [Deltaproteobacteria bacterium]|nr:VOC family protein [Deltaproteobacteria bacterium]